MGEKKVRGTIIAVRVPNAAFLTDFGLLLTENPLNHAILEKNPSKTLHLGHELLISCHEAKRPSLYSSRADV